MGRGAERRLTCRALEPADAAAVDRVHISYLPDRSWARIDLFVVREGRRYQMQEPLYADDVRWNEVELR